MARSHQAQSHQALAIRSDGMLCQWNSQTGRFVEIRDFRLHETSTTPAIFFDIALAPDGTLYAVGGNAIYRLVDTIALIRAAGYCAAFASSGRITRSSSCWVIGPG